MWFNLSCIACFLNLRLLCTMQAAEGAHGHHHKKPKPKEIPVPEVKKVPTYTRDYLPTFKIPDTYIRGKGGMQNLQPIPTAVAAFHGLLVQASLKYCMVHAAPCLEQQPMPELSGTQATPVDYDTHASGGPFKIFCKACSSGIFCAAPK